MNKEKKKLVFNKIRELLKKNSPNNYREFEQYEECIHIVIDPIEQEQSPIWFEFDIGNSELIVGYGISHIHYGKQYGNKLSDGFNQFFDFLISKKRRIDYFKGKTNYKNEYEFENDDGIYENYGTSLIWAFPFWKKTIKKTTYQNGFIEYKKVEHEIEKIRKMLE